MSGNSLTGTIPSELGDLSSIERLYLGANLLTGTIPSALGNLSSVERLVLGNNSLTGTIPSELGGLSNLEWLNLSNNSLTGTIPSELGDLSNLTDLELDINSLTGTIPSELGNLSNLERLYLNNNSLTGCIPKGLQAPDGGSFVINPQKNNVTLPVCVGPTVTITGVPSKINSTTQLTATFTWSEDVTGFVTGDVTVTGGTKGTFAGSGTSYTLVVTPMSSTNLTVSVAANSATDGSSNTGPWVCGDGDGDVGRDGADGLDQRGALEDQLDHPADGDVHVV